MRQKKRSAATTAIAIGILTPIAALALVERADTSGWDSVLADAVEVTLDADEFELEEVELTMARSDSCHRISIMGARI